MEGYLEGMKEYKEGKYQRQVIFNVFSYFLGDLEGFYISINNYEFYEFF